MGGSGSGGHYHWWRTTKKTAVEDCRYLDANRWMREGLLAANVWHSGSWCWYRDRERREQTSSMMYVVNTQRSPPEVRLIYTLTTDNFSVDYAVQLTTTRPRFGGLRWWFVCPLLTGGVACNRRVGKLYLPPRSRYYGCRQCYQLTYTSCQESHRFDSLYRHMASNLGCSAEDVKQVASRLDKRNDW
jgi:hypothetical protein